MFIIGIYSNNRLEPATLLKLTLLHGCFSRFLNCTKWYQIAQRTTNAMVSTIKFPNLIFKYLTNRKQRGKIGSTFSSYGPRYSRMDKVKFVEDSLWKICRDMVHFKIFKGCRPQILLGPFLNTWNHMRISYLVF